MTVTRFWEIGPVDESYSGYKHIYILATFKESCEWFEDEYGVDPRDLGQDEVKTRTFNSMEQASGEFRHCARENGQYIEEPRDPVYSQYRSVDEYLEEDEILLVENV